MGNGASGAVIRTQNSSVVRSTLGRNVSGAEAHDERHDRDPRRGGDLGRQVAGGVGDDGDAGHGPGSSSGAGDGRHGAGSSSGGGSYGARTPPGKHGSGATRARRPDTLCGMERPVLAVIFGTFTLRLATGVTGAMLVYYLAVLPQYGGQTVEPWEVGVIGALFYAGELIASPIFGVLSDRVGHRRVMLIGPAFGAVAVIITAFTVSLPVIGFTRVLEGVSTAASVPSILGFIAFATAADELHARQGRRPVRGRDPRGADAGLRGRGAAVRRAGPGRVPRQRARVRDLVLDLPLRRPDGRRAGARRPQPRPRGGPAALLRILRGSHVWLLAPTWIAINATLGLYTSQTLFQLVREPDPQVRRPAADGRLRARSRSASGSRSAACCSSSACSTGAASSRRCAGRRSSCTGSSAGR